MADPIIPELSKMERAIIFHVPDGHRPDFLRLRNTETDPEFFVATERFEMHRQIFPRKFNLIADLNAEVNVKDIQEMQDLNVIENQTERYLSHGALNFGLGLAAERHSWKKPYESYLFPINTCGILYDFIIEKSVKELVTPLCAEDVIERNYLIFPVMKDFTATCILVINPFSPVKYSTSPEHFKMAFYVFKTESENTDEMKVVHRIRELIQKISLHFWPHLNESISTSRFSVHTRVLPNLHAADKPFQLIYIVDEILRAVSNYHGLYIIKQLNQIGIHRFSRDRLDVNRTNMMIVVFNAIKANDKPEVEYMYRKLIRMNNYLEARRREAANLEFEMGRLEIQRNVG